METPVLSPECPFTGVPCMYTRLYPSVLRFLRYWTVVKYRHTLIGQSLHNTYYYLCLSSSHHVKFMNSTRETECYLFGCGGCAGSLLRVLVHILLFTIMSLKVPKANNIQIFKDGYKVRWVRFELELYSLLVKASSRH